MTQRRTRLQITQVLSRVAASAGARRALPRALFTFLLLTAATVWLWHGASMQASRLARTEFNFRAKETQFALEQRLKAYEQVLRGGVALFSARGNVDRAAWQRYVQALDIGKNYPGIQGIGYALHLPSDQLDAHVGAVRSEGFADYSVRPSGAREEYTAIVYLEPFDWRNQRAFGYDMFSEPVRRAAMAAARDSGLPTVSGKVILVQETSQDVQSGFLMYLPVYHQGKPLSTPAQRAAALQGYVYAPFRMNDLMQGVLVSQAWTSINLQIFDDELGSEAALLYDSLAGSRMSRPATSAFVVEQTFEFDNRRWWLRFSSPAAVDVAMDVRKPWLILIGGLLISLLGALVVWWSSINKYRARELADEVERRTRLAAQLEQAKNEAEAANRAKSDFLANVSHELRTPLTLMLGPLDQLLSQSAAAADWRVQTERVQRNALRLLNHVNDLLDFSRAEAGKVELHWEDVDLRTGMTALLEDAAAAANATGRSLSWHVDEELVRTCTDVRCVEKILLNLVGNALKFTAQGQRIDVAMQAVDGDWWELAVTDTGIGIPADALPRLFERFSQLDTSATRRHGGTGIGLALVKELAQVMGGRVGVTSELGHGSRFSVQLPRCNPRVAGHIAAQAQHSQTETALRKVRLTADAPPLSPDIPATDGSGTYAPRVLLADDHADMRAYVAELLRGDHQVLLAENGLQAWELLQRQKVDLVVSDVMMPGLDGLTLTARIKTTSMLAHVPVILLTARGGEQACVGGLAVGADDYIAKPFSPDELKARVAAGLRMSQVQTQLRERAREAGMAMLATGLLHNLGNALVGVTTSCAVMRERFADSAAGRLRRLAALMRKSCTVGGCGPALAVARGDTIAAYTEALADLIEDDHTLALNELQNIQCAVTHAAAVIASQQDLAKPGVCADGIHQANMLMDEACDLATGAYRPDGIALERDYRCHLGVRTDRHKVLQILLNLLANAFDSLADAHRTGAAVILRTRAVGDRLHLTVVDNGTGIAAEHLPSLFSPGFTTKPEGHGYGLHSSANWARELGGELMAYSHGPGRGASFTLALPLHKPTAFAPEIETGVHAD